LQAKQSARLCKKRYTVAMANQSKFVNDLSKDQYDVLVNAATEAPFSGEYVHTKDGGKYVCAACSNLLFSSQTKFDSGSGWPSFYDVMHDDSVRLVDDSSHGMKRVEVRCANCDAHLGHLFQDAIDQPTGSRYCINSLALSFKGEKLEGSP
jgi:peptide-methionine (R)-S-oxide reductase